MGVKSLLHSLILINLPSGLGEPLCTNRSLFCLPVAELSCCR